MNQFRCWFCNRYFRKPDESARARIPCPCGHSIRVPRRDWRSSKPWSFTNWLPGAVVYGGGMGLFAFGFAFVLFGRHPLVLMTWQGWAVFSVFALVGATFGVVAGERGVGRVIDWFSAHGSTLLRSSNTGPG